MACCWCGHSALLAPPELTSCYQNIVTILSERLAKKVTAPRDARGQLHRSPGPGRLCYRRCSERQRGSKPLVSEWFVSEGRLDHWAYRSSPHRWRCSSALISR